MYIIFLNRIKWPHCSHARTLTGTEIYRLKTRCKDSRSSRSLLTRDTPLWITFMCNVSTFFLFLFFFIFLWFFFIFFFVFHLLSFFSLAFSFVCLFVWFFSFLGNQVETLPIPTSWNRHIFTMGTFHQSPGLLLHLIPLNYWSVPSFGSTQSRCILGHISSIWFCFFFNDILSGFVNRSKRSVLY